MKRSLVLRLTARSFTLVACETTLIVFAVVAAAYLRLGGRAWEVFALENGVPKALLIAGIAQLCLYYADLYDLRLLSDRRELFTRILNALAWASMILAAIYYWVPDLIIGRGVFCIAAVLVMSLGVGWRMAVEWGSRRVRPRERLLLGGTAGAAVDLAREIFAQRHALGVEIVGFIEPDPARVG